MDVRATLRPAPWDGGDSEQVAIVLPGRGYTPDMPLLLWTCRTLHAHGWSTQQVWWEDQGPVPENFDDALTWVQSIAGSAVDQVAGEARRVLLVGKSLGSLAIPYAAEHGIAGIWLTPLIAPADWLGEAGPAMAAAVPKLPPSLLIGGTADSSWDGSLAAASGHTVCELDGADHGLEIPGDPAASIDALKQVVLAVRQYASTG